MNAESSRSLARSVGAILAGMIATIAPTVATDYALQTMGVFPSGGQAISEPLFVLATIYRTLFGVAGSYLTAWLAPYRPMLHAMVGGFIGLAASIAGAASTWDEGPELGSKWYPLALVVLALPSAWLGGWLRIKYIALMEIRKTK